MKRLLDWLFGCPHAHTTFPLTPRGGRGTYIVCLDCGEEFAYDWEQMQVSDPRPRKTPLKHPRTAP